jgi:hypothetical protein
VHHQPTILGEDLCQVADETGAPVVGATDEVEPICAVHQKISLVAGMQLDPSVPERRNRHRQRAYAARVEIDRNAGRAQRQ